MGFVFLKGSLHSVAAPVGTTGEICYTPATIPPPASSSPSSPPTSLWRLYWDASKPEKWWHLTLVFVFFVTEGSMLFSPYFIKWFIDGMTRGESSQVILQMLAGFGALRVFGLLGRNTLQRIERHIILRGVSRLMIRLYEYVLTLSPRYFADTPSGKILHRIQRIGPAFERMHSLFFYQFLFAAVSFLFLSVNAALKEPVLLLVIFLYTGGSVGSAIWYSRRIRPYDREKQRVNTEATGFYADALAQATTIISHGTQRYEMRKANGYLETSEQATRAVRIQRTRFFFILRLIAISFEIGFMGVLFYGWTLGRVTIGDFILFQFLMMPLMNQMREFPHAIRDWHEAQEDGQEALKILQTAPEIVDTPGAKALKVPAGEIVCDQVAFGYGMKAGGLRGVSLTIAAGERIALVGRSGAGKSTFVKLLMRLYDVEDGYIAIDGQHIDRVTQESLRKQIAFVPQDPALFHRTIGENIAYGKPNATQKEIEAAAKKAACHDFIKRLPNGYDTLVGERGVKLSGGERQRVAIARAILKNAPILILDEATSALDSESEQSIQAALVKAMEGKTVIAIAHRLSTIRHMDRIIILDDGRVVDEGSHDALMAKKSLYRDFWTRQTKGFIG